MEKHMKSQNDGWRRRQAVQLAAQLPESRADAIAVLEYVRQIAESHMFPLEGSYPQALETDGNHGRVLELCAGPISPKRRASSNGSPSAFPK